MARTISTMLLGLVVLPALVAYGQADERKVREALSEPTRLECKDFPLPPTLEFLADYHDIEIVLDKPELKKMKLDLEPSQVTKNTTGRLDDTLTEIIEPFNLSFMIEGGKLLITSQPKSRAWQEKYALDTGRTK